MCSARLSCLRGLHSRGNKKNPSPYPTVIQSEGRELTGKPQAHEVRDLHLDKRLLAASRPDSEIAPQSLRRWKHAFFPPKPLQAEMFCESRVLDSITPLTVDDCGE
jgi:hypothetical protein